MSGSLLRKKQLPQVLVVHANVTQMREGRVSSDLSSSFLNDRAGLALQSKLDEVLKCTIKAPSLLCPLMIPCNNHVF